MKIIGLMGTAGAGKDTVARFMMKNHGFERVAFADPLKALALELNPEISRRTHANGIIITEPLAWTVTRLGWEKAKAIPEVREYLQRLGVAAREKIHKDVWVDAAFARMKQEGGDPRYVITDVRFPNEIARVQSVGELWRVDRDGVEPPNNHVSETAWRQAVPDVVVPNNGTIQELEQTVTKLWADGA